MINTNLFIFSQGKTPKFDAELLEIVQNTRVKRAKEWTPLGKAIEANKKPDVETVYRVGSELLEMSIRKGLHV